jgi:hypothetical protein
MASEGAILAFINYKQAAQFGHVGWGFRLDNDSYYFGSTDHLWKHDWWNLPAWIRYMHVPADGDIDWWAEQGSRSEMLKQMKSGPHIRYHAYKEIELTDSTPESALKFTDELRRGGWNLAKHNCVHQAFLIFSNYNSTHDLPSPFTDPLNLIPKNWFARISGERRAL